MINHREDLQKPCPKCGGHDWKIGVATTASGSTVYPYYCNVCGEKTKLYEKKNIAITTMMNYDLKQLTIKVYGNRVCEVCGHHGAELHHWAPRHLFGSEAEKWPKSMLCIDCHKLWHRIVTPLMSIQNVD